MRRALAASLCATALAGCGSASVAELPPAARPKPAPPLDRPPAGRLVTTAAAPANPSSVRADGGRALAKVRPKERTVELLDARTRRRTATASAGVGPSHAAAIGTLLYVTDTEGDALLVFRTRPRLALVRRVYLPGGPYAIALDARIRRLYVTLSGINRLAELPAHGRPHVLRRLPTVRRPVGVEVSSATGRVTVAGSPDGVVQLIDPAAPHYQHSG